MYNCFIYDDEFPKHKAVLLPTYQTHKITNRETLHNFCYLHKKLLKLFQSKYSLIIK